ncbi:hypothetical protein AVJ23_13540 [Pseudoponticoccus marisrubri]|uniref:Uncharacterized protein n=2 Tax=Pseudoponticoccus marisrubri TaxID=1685382 RepID=A0A0W7WIP8_9RHOB|nr:hypothetical protein AVJ23_13540 [Pseudoponticoccus marisrubri]
MPLNVHPQDQAILAGPDAGCFNLDYPPPAFIGDIVNAKVVILLLNGGFDPEVTPAEFPDTASEVAYRDRLARPRLIEDRHTAPYYLGRNYTQWLREGRAAVLNAVAYRSRDTGDACVARLAKVLPSAEFHRTWLRETLWPEVSAGRRFVVVNRWGLWNGADAVFRNCDFATGWHAARSRDLSRREYDAASRFLARQTG